MNTVRNDRWEHGSFMQWTSPDEPGECLHPWGDNCVLCASGRDALRALIEHGRQERGWKRLYVPCYYCQEVVESLLSTGIEVRLYPNGPEDQPPHPGVLGLASGDVLLRVCFFGLQDSLNSDIPNLSGAEVVDDYSHDPWCQGAWRSDADWAIVSLRKTLPLPDGGVLWSPQGHQLPRTPRITERHRLISLEKLAAMVLKTEYLAGNPVPKEVYRRLALSSEDSISQGHISGMPDWTQALVDCMPAFAWREIRRANYHTFAQAVADLSWLRVMKPVNTEYACPFSAVILIEDRELHNSLRTELIAHRIYPTTLWPMDKPAIDDIPPEYLAFSHRMLSIQCDARYTGKDLLRVADIIRRFSAQNAPGATRMATGESLR